MTNYPIQTVDTAPDGAREKLAALRQALGFVPNAAGVMANSLPLLRSFLSAFGTFRGDGTFTPAQRQILLLSNAVANRCDWAVAFHSYEALQDGVADADVKAIRQGGAPADARLAALSTLTRLLIERRGRLDAADVKAFTAAGFDDHQVLEVIAGVAISAMTNYTGNVARPPLEPVIQPYAWSPDGAFGG
jgi:alkylhydroperoxidase family enzyme